MSESQERGPDLQGMIKTLPVPPIIISNSHNLRRTSICTNNHGATFYTPLQRVLQCSGDTRYKSITREYFGKLKEHEMLTDELNSMSHDDTIGKILI